MSSLSEASPRKDSEDPASPSMSEGQGTAPAVGGSPTINEARLQAIRLLASAGDEHAELSAEWLLEHVGKLSRAELYARANDPLPLGVRAAYLAAVARRAAGEPLQYIMGEAAFRTITVATERGVLIPRPETELLVELVLQAISDGAPKGSELPNVSHSAKAASALPLADRGEEPRVLEIGCGTGCIALSLAAEYPGLTAVATDVSGQAVALAERNAKALGLEDAVTFYEGDLASPLPGDLWGTFDVLVSNPPYVPSDVLPTLPREVRAYEPSLAMDGGPDGLDVFRRILEVAPKLLKPRGLLGVELFETQLGAAQALAQQTGDFEPVRVVEDLTHRPRFLLAWNKER